MNRPTRAWGALSACALAAMFCMNVLAADAPIKGSHRLYRDAAGLEWCVSVIALDTGVDGRAWVWFGFVHDPRRVEHVPSEALGAECAASTVSPGPVPLKPVPLQRGS